MAITLVGTPQTGSAMNGGNVTLTFSTTPNENDIVLVTGGSSIWRTPNPAAPTGYTQIALNANHTFVGAWYKRMGASPDSSVVCNGTGNANDATAYISYVLRGVDTTTALDAVATTAGETTSENPDSPSITTVTNGAWVIACAGSRINDATPGTVSGYTNQFSIAQPEAAGLTVAAATLEKTTAGAENPGAWGTWFSGLWFAMTIAFRPATGWANITKINGVTSSSVSKVNDIAVASISKINGIAV